MKNLIQILRYLIFIVTIFSYSSVFANIELDIDKLKQGSTWKGVLPTSAATKSSIPSLELFIKYQRTAARKPEWQWKEIATGNGTFRVYLDSLRVEPFITQKLSFKPEEKLEYGAHILFVQAQDKNGSWSDYSWSKVYIKHLAKKPLLKGKAETSSLRPTWTWGGGGYGNGKFQFQLNDSGWSKKTIQREYTPPYDLQPGTHHFQVRELSFNNWPAIPAEIMTIILPAREASKPSPLLKQPRSPKKKQACAKNFYIAGKMLDADNKQVIAGAKLTILIPGTRIYEFTGFRNNSDVFSSATSDSQGNYQLPNPLTNGESYSMLIEAKGYDNKEKDDAKMDACSNIKVNFELKKSVQP